MEYNNKQKFGILISAIVVVILLIVGITYAYFSNSGKANIQQATSGDFSIAYLDDSETTINLENAVPIKEDEIFDKAAKIEFSVKNTGDHKAILKLDLVDINMDANLGTNDMYWALYQDSTLINKGNFGCKSELVNEKQTILKGVNLDKSITNTYQLYVYILESGKDQSNMMNGSLSASIQANGGNIEYTQTYDYLGKCPNEPDLLDNTLIPVVYNEETSSWTKANTNEKWYDYNEQWWANAVTVSNDASTCTSNCQDDIEKHNRDYYINAESNTSISMDDIETMWVWIPRYNYDTTNLGNNYAGGTQAQPGEIKVQFVYETDVSTEDSNYTHPAFTFGEKQLTGIWVAKFEMSSDCLNNPSSKSSNVCIKYGGGNTTNEKALIKPNMISWRDNAVSNFFTVSRTLSASNNTYGISTNANSHLIKNIEWGAVAYLSQSKYGKYGNSDYEGVNKEVYKNDSSGFYTGKSRGKLSAYGYTETGTYEYDNPINGTGASTTGNIYGIYDMSGGSFEYVMGNYNNTVEESGFSDSWFSDTNNQKYYDKYTNYINSGQYIKGDATYETSEWYYDYSDSVNKNATWFNRGGNYNSNTSAGVFHYDGCYGDNDNYIASRIVLVH